MWRWDERWSKHKPATEIPQSPSEPYCNHGDILKVDIWGAHNTRSDNINSALLLFHRWQNQCCGLWDLTLRPLSLWHTHTHTHTQTQCVDFHSFSIWLMDVGWTGAGLDWEQNSTLAIFFWIGPLFPQHSHRNISLVRTYRPSNRCEVGSVAVVSDPQTMDHGIFALKGFLYKCISCVLVWMAFKEQMKLICFFGHSK